MTEKYEITEDLREPINELKLANESLAKDIQSEIDQSTKKKTLEEPHIPQVIAKEMP